MLKRLQRELDRLLEVFGLQHWAVVLVTDDFEGVSAPGRLPQLGHVKRSSDALWAEIRIATKGRSESEIRDTLAHEVAHLLLADLDDLFKDAVGKLGGQAESVLEDVWVRCEEQAVTRIVRVIGGFRSGD